MVALAGLLSLVGCKTPENIVVPSPVENDTIIYFSLSEGGGMNRFSGFRYNVKETEDGKVHFLFNEGYPDEKEFTLDDHSVFDSLQVMVQKYKMYNWSGHYQPEFDIMDGTSWSLYVRYASRKTISAGGYMAGPDGYWFAIDEIRACLDRIKEANYVEVNGVLWFNYRYGDKRFHIERQDDHVLVAVDDQATGAHETYEKPLEMLEELRLMAITEGLRENNNSTSTDPDSTPFEFELLFSNGDHYDYESYDLKYQCHYTEVIHWFLRRWELFEY